MIKVTLIKENDQIIGLEVSGHALFAELGKDLICAGVSSIIVGGFNAFSDDDIDEIKLDAGYAKVRLKPNRGQEILHTIIVQLKTIENSYPKYIKIK